METKLVIKLGGMKMTKYFKNLITGDIYCENEMIINNTSTVSILRAGSTFNVAHSNLRLLEESELRDAFPSL